MRQADMDNTLKEFFNPQLHPAESGMAEIEGWILGIK
jgi:hypothetical protein